MKNIKVKDILDVQTRVSMYQTCINNAKGRTVVSLMKSAKMMYAILLEDLQEFGGIEIRQLQEIAAKAKPKRRTPKRKADKLLKKVYKKQVKEHKKVLTITKGDLVCKKDKDGNIIDMRINKVKKNKKKGK